MDACSAWVEEGWNATRDLAARQMKRAMYPSKIELQAQVSACWAPARDMTQSAGKESDLPFGQRETEGPVEEGEGRVHLCLGEGKKGACH